MLTEIYIEALLVDEELAAVSAAAAGTQRQCRPPDSDEQPLRRHQRNTGHATDLIAPASRNIDLWHVAVRHCADVCKQDVGM